MNSGKVVVIGGYDLSAAPFSNNTESYDPATDAWIYLPNPTRKRFNHAATVLDNGKVLVTGGLTSMGGTNTAELFDLAMNNWSGASSMGAVRYGHAATRLQWHGVAGFGGKLRSDEQPVETGAVDGPRARQPLRGAAGFRNCW